MRFRLKTIFREARGRYTLRCDLTLHRSVKFWTLRPDWLCSEYVHSVTTSSRTMNRPHLIVFEGVDATGKSTVCAEFLKRLLNEGIAAKLLTFPGRDPRTLGNLVYQLHHDPLSQGVERLSPSSLQALHIAAHLDAIETIITPALEAGETVLLDRYWWSTWVYGIVGGANPPVLRELIDAERSAWGRWQPGIVFHVTRDKPLRDEPIEIWEMLVREYDALAERESESYPVRRLPNDGSLVETVESALTLAGFDEKRDWVGRTIE